MSEEAADRRRRGEFTVTAFLGCATTRDWALAESLLESDVTREGPDGALTSGRDAYLGYLRNVLGDRTQYSSTILRLASSQDGSWVVAELDEELLEAGLAAQRVRELMLFELRGSGRIGSISVYAKHD